MVLIKQLKGYQDYDELIRKMEKNVSDLKEKDRKEEEIWILEHKDIITAGSSSVNFNAKMIYEIPVRKVNRGGQLTYHGPGQIVIYFMINIKKRKIGVIQFIEKIEKIMMNAFKNEDIFLYTRKEKNRGLWIKTNRGLKKIIFIGLRYTSGIIYHGLSINLNPNLTKFRSIIPCGLNKSDISSLTECKIIVNKNKMLLNIKNQLNLEFP